MLLITGLTQQSEHIFLIGLNTGLVEGIDSQNISGNCAGKLEEVDQIAQRVRTSVGKLKQDIGNTAILVCQKRTDHSGLFDIIKLHAGQEIQAVNVIGIDWNFEVTAGIFD